MKFPARFYLDGFILSILGAVAVASIFPAHGLGEPLLDWAVKIAIGLLFLLYGARLSPAEALSGLKHWRLHAVVMTATFVLFPVLGLVMRLLVPSVLTRELYAGVLFLTLVPSTVQSSIAFTSIAKGNVAGAIVSATFSNLAGVFVTPLLVILLMETSGELSVNPSSIIDIVLQLLLPFIVGQLLRPRVSGWLARYREPTRYFDRGSIVLVVYSVFSHGMNEGIWGSLSWANLLSLAAVCCVLLATVLAITWGAGRALGFPLPDRLVILFCGSKKSLATGLPMATVLLAGQSVGLMVLPLMIFHQVQLIACAALAQRFARKHDEAVAAPAD